MVAPNYDNRRCPTGILVVHEDKNLLRLLQCALAGEGCEVAGATNGDEALKQIPLLLPSLIVLDLALPLRSGFEICRQLRGETGFGRIPVLVLAARTDEAEIALDLGADDHVAGPFAFSELLLRMRRLLRAWRPDGMETGEAEIALDELHVDIARHEATVLGTPVRLTSTEFKLLAVLTQRRGRVQTRERLLRDVWDYNSRVDTRTVDTHVLRLRRKLGPACRHLESVRGVGYRMVESPAPAAGQDGRGLE
jgi:two-component system, OmpR family, phosphate regulon response regulator PhoB